MASATDLDIFTRSLGGDRRARNELFKRYFRDSSRVCRLGVGYADRSEFLHDCLGNFLRTAHSWDQHGSLSLWVESVAAWTALQNERQRDINSRGAKGSIRMCAEHEGEDGNHGQVLSAYAPPVLGADDSPAVRILAVLAEPEKTLFRKRAIEGGTWEEAAEAAGKSVNIAGPAFVRAIARMARLFGAPPPMDEDLLPTFERTAADPGRPEGRANSMRLDSGFYQITPEGRRLGLTTNHEVRTLQLWGTAASSSPPGEALRRHLEECHHCTTLLRALILMHQALHAGAGKEFYLCPGSFTLATAPDLARDVFDRHLTQCSACRSERTLVLDEQSLTPLANESSRFPTRWQPLLALAAFIVVAVAGFAGYRYFASRRGSPSGSAGSGITLDAASPTVNVDPRYKDLVQEVKLDDDRVMASVLPANRPAIKFAIDQFALGQWSHALQVASQLADKGDDPGATMLYAMCLYRTQLMSDGYHEMLKAETMPPRDTFRCWITFQFALMVGDREVVNREAQHLSVDPEYKDKVKAIMQKVQERG
jgi:DNA-directed RNA polymerase specialized sigma24 family protein